MAKEKLYCRLELKSNDDSSEYATFSGYGSVFGNIDEVNDIVEYGAFAKTLANKNKVPMLWQHDQRQPIGIFKNMREDSTGLYVEGEINKQTQKGMEAYSLLKQGAIDGLSIGFRTKEFSIDTSKGIRRIKSADLYEISLVTFPANTLATATDIKCFIDTPRVDKMEIREFEQWLRDELNCSHTTAKTIASRGFKAATENRDGLPSEQQGNVDALAIAIKEAIKGFRVNM